MFFTVGTRTGRWKCEPTSKVAIFGVLSLSRGETIFMIKKKNNNNNKHTNIGTLSILCCSPLNELSQVISTIVLRLKEYFFTIIFEIHV